MNAFSANFINIDLVGYRLRNIVVGVSLTSLEGLVMPPDYDVCRAVESAIPAGATVELSCASGVIGR